MKYYSQIKNDTINIYLFIDMEFTIQNIQNQPIFVLKYLENIQIGVWPYGIQILSFLLHLL